MTVSGVVGWLNIRGLRLTAEPPDEVYDGQEAFVAIRLENGKRRVPSFLLRVELEGERCDFLLVDRGATEAGSLSLTFRGRGRRSIGRAVVSSPFPINFFVRSTTLELDERLIVFPAPRPCALPAGSGGRRSRGEAQTRAKGYEGEVEKIADYTGSEPLKLIHWRLSARHENLKVKEMTAAADEPVVIDLAALPGKGVEENLSFAAFLVNRHIRANRPVGLATGGRTIPPDNTRHHRLKLLTELALHGTH